MPLQVYRCPKHGEFDIRLSFRDDVPQATHCLTCGAPSLHIIKPPAAAIVRDGTGGGRGNGAVRKQLAWDTQANEMQRDPYTQAMYQAKHMVQEQRDMGVRIDKPTEAGIQAAAAEIAKKKTWRDGSKPSIREKR